MSKDCGYAILADKTWFGVEVGKMELNNNSLYKGKTIRQSTKSQTSFDNRGFFYQSLKLPAYTNKTVMFSDNFIRTGKNIATVLGITCRQLCWG